MFFFSLRVDQQILDFLKKKEQHLVAQNMYLQKSTCDKTYYQT